QREQSQHPARASLFPPVRIIAIRILEGVGAAIINVVDANLPTLPHDLGREIDLIVRRTNAWADFSQHIARIGPPSLHLPDGMSNHPKRRAFFPAMDQTNDGNFEIK